MAKYYYRNGKGMAGLKCQIGILENGREKLVCRITFVRVAKERGMK